MNSSWRFWMYGVMSYSHFCDANSAVQTTSDSKTSQSADLARWRWMNWLRCSSADSGNSRSFAVRPGLALLNSLTPSMRSPDVSLPVQYVTLPLALSIDFGSIFFAPSIFWPPEEPPPPPLLLLLLLSDPHAATTTAMTAARQTTSTNLDL